MDAVHIWIVDDNKPDVFLMEMGLRRINCPFELSVIDDGEIALEKIGDCEKGKARAPGIIFLDRHLPRVSGIEVLQAIRNSPSLKNACVAMFRDRIDPPAGLQVDRWVRKHSGLDDFLQEIESVARDMMSPGQSDS